MADTDASDGDGGDAPALPTFDRPAEPFVLGGELGRGGMGRVIAAVDRALDRPVAIKQALSQRPDDLRRFEREARITARLEHPAIVPVHEAGRDGDGNPFYVMRRIAGQPLAERIAAARSTRELLALVPNVLAAVDAAAFAHARGVIHRDIKPTNILVGAYGETLLIDWGLARELGERDSGGGTGGSDGGAPLTRAGDMFGTPGYMAPEQVRDAGAVDARADVHALGATLFHVVAGEPPFTGTAAHYAAAVATGWRPDLARISPDVPRELVTIVGKATASDPAARYRDAGELAADLRAFLAGNLVAAHRYTTLERLARFVRRHRAAVAVATLAAVALAGGAAIAVLRVVDAERAARQRADQLLLEHARGLLADDPVRALALLRFADHLDPADSWAFGVEAVWRGLPQVWPAHASPVRALALLDDGGVASSGLLDQRVVLRRPGGERRDVAHYDRAIMQLIALPGGFAVATATTVDRFDLAGARIATWPAHDATRLAAGAGYLAQRDTQGITVRELASGREVLHVAGDRDADFAFDRAGKWLAIGDRGGGRVVEVATGAAHELVPATTVVWSPRGDRLVLARSNSDIASYATGDWASPPVQRKPAWLGVGFVGDVAVYVDRASHCLITLDRDQIYACVTGLRSWTSQLGAIGFDGTALTVRDGTYQLRLGSVPGRPDRVIDDAQRHRLVAAGDGGRIALWDLAARGSATRSLDLGFAYFAGDDVIADVGGTITRIPSAGAAVPLVALGTGNPFRVFVPVGDAFAVLEGGGAFYAARRDQHDVIAASGIEAMVARNDHQVIARRADGVIALIDIVQRKGRQLVRRTAPPNELRVDGGRFVMSWRDGHVYWLDPDDGEHAADVGCPVRAARWPSGGTLEVACANRLYAWRGERLHPLAELPAGGELADWTATAAGYALATADGAVYRAAGGRITQLNPGGLGAIALGRDRFASSDNGSGRIYIHDVRTGARAQIGQVDMPARLALSEDGRALIALTPGHMMRWDDPSPRDPAQRPAWLARLTPATLREPDAALDWP